MNYTLHLGDCLDYLRTLPDGSVDAVITDPPYGTTSCEWDSVIPLAPMWEQLRRVIRPRAAVVLFGAQPFASTLVLSNVRWFKYELIAHKKQTGAPGVAKIRPLPVHESILVFGNGAVTYNPIMSKGEPYKVTTSSNGNRHGFGFSGKRYTNDNPGIRYPVSVVNCVPTRYALHPTQKPVSLMTYLIRTYSNAGDTVLDFTMGSGTTGVACMQTGRNFIGIEIDPGYFAIAKKRIEDAAAQLPLIPHESEPKHEQAELL